MRRRPLQDRCKGGRATTLTINADYDFNPVWAPYSKSIALASDCFRNFKTLSIPIEGGNPKRLSFYSEQEVPGSFTTDSKHILSRIELK